LVQALKDRGGASVLRFARNGAPGVVAKAGRPELLSVEDFVYSALLPELPFARPPYYGLADDGEGLAWLFIGEVSGEKCRTDRPAHMALAARWLSILHTLGGSRPAAECLPDRGTGYYLGLLREARETIERTSRGRRLKDARADLLDRLVDRCDFLEAMWPEIDRACSALPTAVVHGDFKKSNAIVHPGDAGPELVVFDWEMAGRGVPTVDLLGLDVEEYSTLVCPVWGLGANDLRIPVLYGRILRIVACINWASASLHFDWIEPPLARLRHYGAWLEEALEEATLRE
jgi:hypothetical protein